MLFVSAGEEKDLSRIRRAYRLTFAASVCLAAIGAPVLMQGTVALVEGITHPQPGEGAMIQGLVVFCLSGIPMMLAWFAWRRTKIFLRELDEGA